jgi:subtilase family serine protease
MRFEPAPTKTWQKFEIGSSAKVFPFTQGKSYFEAFALGEAPIRQIIFRVHILGATKYNRSIFCPSAVLLDQAFVPIGTPEIPLQYVAPTWTANGYLAGRMEVPAAARYVVIHTSNAQGGHVPISVRREGFAYSTGTSTVFVPGRGFEKVELPCAPTGSFDMWTQLMPK